MLRHPGLEAVVIATVTTVHAEQAIKAIQAGKHVLCEKPLSTSVEIVRTNQRHVMSLSDESWKVVSVGSGCSKSSTRPQGHVRILEAV